MYLLYDLCLFLAALLLLPYFLVQSLLRGGERLGIRQRLGFYSPAQLDVVRGKRVFWVHAVSVGETRAAVPLLRALKEAYPDSIMVLSNTTQTGHAISCGLKEVDLSLYFPFDHSWVVRRVLRQIRPELIVIVETELWPNFIRLARSADIPVVMVNGRISDRSFPRYRLVRRFLHPVLDNFSAFCMQSQADAEKIRLLGADETRLQVTRNLKFDMQASVPGAAEIALLKKNFGFPPGALVWTAGSTRPGEEELVVDTYRQLVREGQSVFLVLVPRHPERARVITEMVAARDLRHALRSDLETSKEKFAVGEVLIVDTVGELLTFYAASDLVFVGGSLVPVGGHNVLEAALVKKPVVFGPHMHNFKEIAALLLGAGGALRVRDGHELSGMVRQLLDSPEMRTAMGEKGHGLIAENAGATKETLQVIRALLEQQG